MLSLLIVLALMALTVFWSMTYESQGLMLLAYIEAALFVISFFGLIVRMFTIKGHMDIPVGISEKGDKSLIKITIKNNGLFPVAGIKVCIVVCDTMRGTKEKHWLKLPVSPRGESEFVHDMLFSKIGSYKLVLKKLRIYDMTGLMHMDIYTKRIKGELRVMPKLHELPVRLTDGTRNFYGEAETGNEERHGSNNDEMSFAREYKAGDRLQNVHWKLSAKQDELMVKEREMPQACPVVLFLEYNPEKRSVKKHEIIPYIEVAVKLSFSLMSAGCLHYVVWYDGKEKDVKRLRVHDEESLFFFIDTIMKVEWINYQENMLFRYQEKYKREPYAHALWFDTDFCLKKDDELIGRISKKKIDKSLEQIEILI